MLLLRRCLIQLTISACHAPNVMTTMAPTCDAHFLNQEELMSATALHKKSVVIVPFGTKCLRKENFNNRPALFRSRMSDISPYRGEGSGGCCPYKTLRAYGADFWWNAVCDNRRTR